jgi:hypothetical protein
LISTGITIPGGNTVPIETGITQLVVIVEAIVEAAELTAVVVVIEVAAVILEAGRIVATTMVVRGIKLPTNSSLGSFLSFVAVCNG